MPKKIQGFSSEFQAMLESIEEEDYLETGSRKEKKMRLTFDQVKALEMNFELENKLEAERKLKLAAELDLHPRQVAIWFQNRRARWKAKQLERDYNILKANYDALKVDINGLELEKQNLTAQLMKLKSKTKEREGGCMKFPQQHQLMASSSSSLSESSVYFLESFDPTIMLKNMNNMPFVTGEEQSTLFPIENSCNIFSIDQAPWYFES